MTPSWQKKSTAVIYHISHTQNKCMHLTLQGIQGSCFIKGFSLLKDLVLLCSLYFPKQLLAIRSQYHGSNHLLSSPLM